MSLTPCTRLGPYEIVSAIGAGGMGEVYRARDMRLKRDVAIKILPQSFASDPDRLARFQREAEVLASLSHPNIAGIYGLEESNGIRALVMELVEGETLADHIARGPIALDEALAIAKQIAEALEAAHEQGIIHRDLKPANIKVRPDGAVKVLDFGLAKLAEAAPAGAGVTAPSLLSMSPTITSPLMTGVGVLLGTAAYMAPEQAKGKPADKRSDIWAFGCVLWEMLVCERLFKGQDVTETIASIVKDEPDWQAVPVQVRPLLRACLAKDARMRLRDIADGWHLVSGQSVHERANETQPRRRVGRWLAAAVFVAAAVAAVTIFVTRQVSDRPVPPVRFRIPFPPDAAPSGRSSPALSPDGRQLAFVTAEGAVGEGRIWVHALDSLDSHPIAGTQGAYGTPFWSADSRFIVFGTATSSVTSGALKKISIDGGPAITLADIPSILRSGFQSADGSFIISCSSHGLFRIDSGGGTLVPFMGLGKGESNRVFPSPLSDRRHFVYLLERGANSGAIHAASTDNANADTQLVSEGANPVYVASANSGQGYLLFSRDDVLLAQQFDERSFKTVGQPTAIGQGVGRGTSENSYGLMSASANGVVVYQEATSLNYMQLAWSDREGQTIQRFGDPGYFGGGSLSLSPSGTRIAATFREQAREEIWLFDVQRGVRSRLVWNNGQNWYPAWSPTEDAIAFGSNQTATGGVYLKRLTGDQHEERLADGSFADDWSRDGRLLAIRRNSDIWLLRNPLTPTERSDVQLTNTPYVEEQGHFSPDGRWLAYVSNQSGSPEVYVRPIDLDAKSTTTETPVQVSRSGGDRPRWRPDGKELFYQGNGKAMSVDVSLEPTLKLGTPKALFEFPRSPGIGRGWDVASNGERFVFFAPVGQTTAPPFTVLLNWQASR